jgi:DNA-binding NarL/FixJ family response regulator
MDRMIFVTSSRVPPSRWRQAFPKAEIVEILPTGVGEGCLVWLHNLTPAQLHGGERPAGPRFIVMEDEPADAAGLTALAQGASGYCHAHATPELLQTIAAVVRNQGLWVGESLLNRLLGGISVRSPVAGKQDGHPALAALSERERAVALCVARGEPNKEIARRLDIAERTVKAHLTSAFEKLGVRDRLQLAVLLNSPG